MALRVPPPTCSTTLKEPLIFLYVREDLRVPFRWSPETIAGRLPIDCPGYIIDDDTIYWYIYGKRQRRMKLWKYLVLHRKKGVVKHGRKIINRGKVMHVISISKRYQKNHNPGQRTGKQRWRKISRCNGIDRVQNNSLP